MLFLWVYLSLLRRRRQTRRTQDPRWGFWVNKCRSRFDKSHQAAERTTQWRFASAYVVYFKASETIYTGVYSCLFITAMTCRFYGIHSIFPRSLSQYCHDQHPAPFTALLRFGAGARRLTRGRAREAQKNADRRFCVVHCCRACALHMFNESRAHRPTIFFANVNGWDDLPLYVFTRSNMLQEGRVFDIKSQSLNWNQTCRQSVYRVGCARSFGHLSSVPTNRCELRFKTAHCWLRTDRRYLYQVATKDHCRPNSEAWHTPV